MRTLLAAAMLVAMTGAGAAADLIVEKADGAAGNTEITFVNKSREPVSIYRVVINDSQVPACTLLPVQSDYGFSLSRGDLFDSPQPSILADRKPALEVVLPFGGEVVGVSFRDCGRPLLLFVYTSDGDEVYEFPN